MVNNFSEKWYRCTLAYLLYCITSSAVSWNAAAFCISASLFIIEEAQNQRSGAESSEMESLEDTPPPADAQTAGNVYSEEQMQSVVYQYEQLRLQYTALVGSVETMTSDNQQLSRYCVWYCHYQTFLPAYTSNIYGSFYL